MGTTSDFCVRPGNGSDGCEKGEKHASHAGSDARTHKERESGRGPSAGRSNGSRTFQSDVEDAHEELASRIAGRRCTQCGKPGGKQWDYRGAAVRLHPECEQI
jgi:hypothetical protein